MTEFLLLDKQEEEEINSTLPPEISKEWLDSFKADEILGIILLVILVGGFFINIVVLILFYSKHSLRTFSNVFIISLSISHLLQLLLVVPSSISSFIGASWHPENPWCDFSATLKVWLDLVIINSLLLIAFDRHVAVNTPLHYPRTITRKKIQVLIATLWLLTFLSVMPIVLKTLPVAFQPQMHICMVFWMGQDDVFLRVYACFLTSVGFVFPVLFLAAIYISMYRAAKTNSARARRYSLSASISENFLSDLDRSETTSNENTHYHAATPPKKKYSTISFTSHHHMPLFGEEWRAAKTGFLMVFSFIVCWAPSFCTILAQSFSGEARVLPDSVLTLSAVLTLLSSIANPYLYVFRNVTNRKMVCDLFCCRRHSPSHLNHVSSNKSLTSLQTCMIVQVLENGNYENRLIRPKRSPQRTSWRIGGRDLVNQSPNSQGMPERYNVSFQEGRRSEDNPHEHRSSPNTPLHESSHSSPGHRDPINFTSFEVKKPRILMFNFKKRSDNLPLKPDDNPKYSCSALNLPTTVDPSFRNGLLNGSKVDPLSQVSTPIFLETKRFSR